MKKSIVIILLFFIIYLYTKIVKETELFQNVNKNYNYDVKNGIISYKIPLVPSETILKDVQAYCKLPNNPISGIKLNFKGTDFGYCEPETINMDNIVDVTPCLLGATDLYDFEKRYTTSRWMVINEIKHHVDVLLDIVYDICKKKYNFEKLNLFIFGHSRGGTSAFSAHFFFQQNNELQKKYDLKHTVCSAGIYVSEILQSTLQPFDTYIKNPYITSTISKQNYAYSKITHDLVLYNFIYVAIYYYAYIENNSPNNYNQLLPGLEFDQSYLIYTKYKKLDMNTFFGEKDKTKDDWQQFKAIKYNVLDKYMPLRHNDMDWSSLCSTIITDDLDQQRKIYKKISFLTNESYNKLTDVNSPLHKKLVDYFDKNLPFDYFGTDFISKNRYNITLVYSKNDINFIGSHPEYLKQKFNRQNKFFFKAYTGNTEQQICPKWYTYHNNTYTLAKSIITNIIKSCVP